MPRRMGSDVAWLWTALVIVMTSQCSSGLSISSVYPRKGSLAGGAMVTIDGSGFSPDHYEGANHVFFGGIPCDVDWFNSANENRLVCWTRPWPEAKEEQSSPYLETLVVVGRISDKENSRWYRQHSYYWWNTPRMEGVTPRSSVFGTVVHLRGWFITNDMRDVQRVMLGNAPCELYKPDTTTLYRENGWNRYEIYCLPGLLKTGFFNATVHVPKYGWSWNHSKALQPGPDGQLYMFEFHPDVTSVYPNVGSSDGGTLLRITGSGFGNVVDKVSVNISGIPCEVQTVTDDLITCFSGPPPPDSPAIRLNSASNLSSVTAFEGVRGVSMAVWKNIYGASVSDLLNSPNYPGQPDIYHNLDQFLSPFHYGNFYGLEMEAFFISHYDSLHSFFFSSDDNGELWFSNSTNISEARKIAFVAGHSSRSYYKTYPGQISEPIHLRKGQKCYLRAIAKEHGGYDFAMAAVLVHNLPFGYTARETKAAVAEHQQVIIKASTHPEIQWITVNYTSSAASVTSAFSLEWDGRQSSPLGIEATNEQVRDAVLGLFEGKCVDNSNEFLDLYDLDTFEDGGSDAWSQLHGRAPARVVYDDAYCGRQSLQVVSGYALNFNEETGLEPGQDSFGYPTVDYPFICMAYRIPTGTHLVLAVNVEDHGWFSIPLTDIKDALPYTYLSDWEDVNGQDIREDNLWHYSCFDLDYALGTKLGEGKQYYVLGVAFTSPEPEYRHGPFYIDEFAIASEVRQLVRTDAPARPNGLVLRTVSVSNTSAYSGDSQSVTFQLVYGATTCFDNFSLIGVNVSMEAASQGISVTTGVLQSASDAVSGTFQLGAFGLWTPPIAHDASNEEFKSALESIPELGQVTVYSWLHDFDRGCSGRAWGFRLPEVANDVPTFEINSELQGQNVMSAVQVIDNGGILFDPIPGYMLRTVEKMPHVHVAVNGVHASCQGSGEEVHATRYSQNTSCQFVYSDDAKPIVTSMSPESGTAGDTVTIYGSGFDSNIKEYDIRFDNVPCTVINATETEVQCIIGDSHAGRHQLHFQVYSSGRANTSLYFTYELSFELLQPTNGSLGGGLIATFIGSGFVDLHSDTNVSQEVLFGTNPCNLVSSSFSYLDCIIPSSDFSGAVNITVVVYDKDGEEISATAVGKFTYSDANTPHVNSVSPTVGSAGGGTVVTISGDGFSTIAEENLVKIGEAACLIVSVSNETIVCQTNRMNPGSYDVVVFVNSKGSSSGSVQFTYELVVDDLSYFTGSLFGGQRIIVSGSGFGDDSSLVHVLLGDMPCDVEVVGDNSIQCVTKSSAKSHHINNFGRHPEYGIGYQWQPQHLTIQVGDTVEWEWTGSPFTVLRSVVQVASENDTEYDGTGFHSEPSTSGKFRHNFDEPGVYFYVSEGHGELGFRGTVTVTGLRTTMVPVTVIVNEIVAEHSNYLRNGSLIAIMSSCHVTDIPGDIMTVAYYSYSVCETPLITDIIPMAVHLGEDIIVQGALFADDPFSSSLNTLTVGGKSCLRSPDVRLSSELPLNATTLNNSEIGSKDIISCTVPKQPPGLYRVIVHVSGRGWGFASLKISTVKYEVAYSVNITSGSVHGGTELVLSGVGFHPKAALSNTVKIGNAVCDVQSLTDSDEWGNGGSLTCITRTSLDDGYSAVVNENQPLGYWKLNDKEIVAVNSGSVGASGNGIFHGNVVTGVDGISGNNWTNRAVQFNSSWVEVPYLPVLNSLSNVSGELWVKVESSVHAYQFVIGSYSDGLKSEGYAIWINPCGHVEFWLAVDMETDHNDSRCDYVEEAYASGSSGGSGYNSSGSVDLRLNSCNQCDGFRTVSLQESDQTGLPAGVWSVMTGQAIGNSWSHIVFSWLLHDSSIDIGIGSQLLYMGGQLVDSRNTNFSHNSGSPLLIGGQLFFDENTLLEYFAGVVDEVALYDLPLSEDAIARHFHYGTSDSQPAVLQYDMEDHRGVGTVPKVKYPPPPKEYHDVEVNWTSVVTDRIYINPSDRLQFYWTGFHSLIEVGRNEFESCVGDTLEKRTVWGLAWSDGAATVVDLESGRLHYFVSDVTGDCEAGHKIQVFVGSERVIEWGLGRVYEAISIAQGTGLRFQWSDGPGVYHDVVEVASEEALEECAVGHMAEAIGSVIARYSQPVTTGNVVLSSLSVGTHYFACAVSGHCGAGMHVAVTVTGDGEIPEDDSGTSIYQTVHIHWRIQAYADIVVTVGDSVVFEWDEFHSLSQVSKIAYDDCDISSPPLKEWARSSVTGSIVVSGFAPGSYYFICAVGGHCQAGMKVTLIVKPKVDGPSLMMPQTANCLTKYCSYTYREDDTPVIRGIEPDHGVPGTVVSVVGWLLLKYDYGENASLSAVLEVRIGDSLCEDPVQLSYSADNQTVSCVVSDQPAGDKNVMVVVYGAGVGSFNDNVYNGSGRLSFTVDARVETMSPNEGSIAGGTVLTIAGSGFSYVKELITVMVGDYECLVTYSSFNEIKCVTTSVASSPDVHNSPLHMSVLIDTVLADSSVYFMYSTNSTPFILNVSSSVLQWGDEISIYGQFHTTDTDEIEAFISRRAAGVQVQGKRSFVHLFDTQQECQVTSVNEGEITCIVGRRVAGDHYVVIVKDINKGYAVSSPESAADVTYELRIDSVTPTMFGLGGGVELTLTGAGFLSATSDGEGSDFGFSPGYSYVDNQKEAATVGQSLTSLNLYGKLVSSFGMDYGVTFAVDVCGQICYIHHSTYNKTVCTVPPIELTENVTITDMLNSEQSCSVEAVISGSSGFKRALSASNVTYSGSLTATIESVSPRRGGTAGGTLLTITGSGFNSTIERENVTVSIDGVECSLRESSDSLLTCRTNPHRTTLDGLVTVIVPGKGKAVELYYGNATTPSSAQFEYIDRWSSRFTWGGNDPPGEGAAVHIQAGQTVLLDTSPTGVLNLLLIDGNLIFDDNQDIHLQAKYILILRGRLQVGTEDEPFMHRAVITLHGNIRDPEIPIYGAKVLGLRQGSLELHGRPRSITWTRLAQTVHKTESILELMEPVDWLEDDVIVIASTSKDGNETETASISSVENGGYRIVLHKPVNYTHYGITDVMEDGQFIDIRAEVGLLSHNVIVQGSQYVGDHLDDLGADQYGSQIMIHRAGADPTPVRLEHVEVRHAGQAFRLGRYAVHFHLSDKMNGSYVRHCSIHHSHNRAITAHGVHEMLFEGVVAYDIKGHTFFIEDGIETGNRYIRNLGLVTRGSSSLLNTDQLPATFWITNPNNTFIGNAAAGSSAYGFWYDLDPHPSGPSFTNSICPNQTPLGEFRDNVAHTNAEFGFRIWETYRPKEFGCWGSDVAANFYNLVSYSNGIHGVELSIVGHVRLIGFKVADNRDNGIEILEAHGSWGGPMIKDALIISHSIANEGKAQTGGIKTPNKRRLIISNVTFARFDGPSLSCLRACSHCKVRQGGFQYWFEKIKYLGNSSLHRTAFKWEHEVLFKDLDGTLAGVPGGWVTPSNGLLPLDHCQQHPEYSLNSQVPGSVCTHDVQLLRLAWNRAQPLATFKGRDVLVSNEHGSTLIPWRHYRLTHMDGYMLTLPSHRVHNLTYILPPSLDVDNTQFSAGLYNVPRNESVIIATFYDTAPNHFRVGSNRQDIGRPLTFSDPHTSWHFDNKTLELQYILSARGQTGELSDLIYDFSKEPCPVTGCPRPDPGDTDQEAGWRRWSVASDWPDNRVPLSGSNVTIQSSWKMYLDLPEVDVEKLDIQGRLKFEDSRDVVLNATWIIIAGHGSLEVGAEASPFSHQAIINLKGNRRTPDLTVARNMILGSKVIGVFGELHLFGRQHNVMWTRLSQSAMVGDSQLHLESSTNVDWQPGEEIVIAPSGYIPSEAEIRTIASVSGSVVTLQQPLQYDHVIDPFLTGNETGSGNEDSRWWRSDGGLRIAPEVGILSHNVRIIGTEDIYNSISVHEFGCRVLVGYYRRGRSEYTGRAFVDSVQFQHCGQGGFFSTRDPRYVVAFKSGGDGAGGSYIRRSSVHTGFNTAFGTLASNNISLSDNVVYRSVDSMFRLRSVDCVVERNLGVLTRSIQVARPGDNHAVDFPATYEIGGSGHTIKDNVAAGSERIGFYYPGESCVNEVAPDSFTAKFWGNSAHTGLMGLVVMGLSEPCSAVGGFIAARQWEYGIFSSIASRLAVRQVAVAVGHTGLCLNTFGPDPVKHLLDYKWIKVEDSLIVGSTEKDSCFSSTPAHCPSICTAAGSPKLGIMMATFAKKRSKMDGTGPWHKVKSYPTIAGQVNLTSVTFARFSNYQPCGHNSFVVGNNELSPDAMHPNYFEDTGLIDVDPLRIVHLWPPNPAWIVQEDCIDMDCDGPKHSVINDIDGQLVGTSESRGSIIPQAELRFDITRLPEAMRYSNSDPTKRLNPEDIVEHRGIARGKDGTFDGGSPGCVWVSSWNAYKCSGLNHQMLVIESMDADTEVRRVSPIAVHGGDTGFGKYTDLMNGPMDHGWCTYYTCLKRLSTFFSIVAVGTDYQLWFTGSNPGHLRFHLLNTYGGPSDVPGEGVRISIWYKNPQRKDVYKEGVFIEPENVQLQNGASRPDSDQYIPQLNSSHSGANYFDRHTQTLHLVVKGSKPVEVTTPPVVQVAFDLAVSIDDFFDPASIVRNLAFVLKIPEELITVVDVIAEDSTRRRRRGLLAENTQSIKMVVEIGKPPAKNITQPETPSVSEQVEEEGGTPFFPIDDNEDNTTDTTQPPPSYSTAGILAKDEDPPLESELASEFDEEKQLFQSQQSAYTAAVDQTNYLNELANELVEQVQTGQLQFENATVTGMSVAPAPPPPEPVEPMPPPGLENLTTSTGEKIYSAIDVATAAPLVVDEGEDNDTNLVFQIPSGASLSRQPPPVSGHLLYDISVIVEDANGQPVENLGWTGTWYCTVTLVYAGSEGNRPVLEGESRAQFQRGGHALFTGLRISQPAGELRLEFFISPSNYTVRSNTFAVVSPNISSTNHQTVQFTFAGDYEGLVVSGPGGSEGFLQELKTSLAKTLNIDVSRLTNIKASPGSIICTVTIFERADTDPADAPTLQSTINYLKRLVEAGLLTMTHGNNTVTVISSSFREGEGENDTEKESSSSSLPIWAIGIIAAGAVLIVVALLLLWVKIYRCGKKTKVDPTRWAVTPRHHRLQAAEVGHKENVYVEQSTNELEMRTLEEIPINLKKSRLSTVCTPVNSTNDRGPSPVGSTTGLLDDDSLDSPPQSKNASRSSLSTPRHSSRDQTRRVVVSPKPPASPEMEGEKTPFVSESGTTAIMVVPRKKSSGSVGVNTNSNYRPGSNPNWHHY